MGQVEGCQALGLIVGFFETISISSNALLFIFRISAVYHDSGLTIWFFVFIWFGVVAGALTQPLSCSNFVPIGQTTSCMAAASKSYCALWPLFVMVYDTLVLFAISTKILLWSLADTWEERLRLFFTGKGMPHLFRLVMQTGQQYYM